MNSKLKKEDKLPSYLRRSSKGGLLVGFIYVIAFMSILFLAIWQTFESEKNKSDMQLVDDRLSLIEEQINIVDETNNDSMTDITSSIQFLDKEVRKLWDLSNKRNKVNIAKLTQDISKHTSALKEIAATQTNDQTNINSIKNESQKLRSAIDELKQANKDNLNTQNKIAELNKSILLLEETVQAFDAYRRQNNEMLQEMQLKILSIESTTSP